jgi:hypothetical protein
VRVALLFGAVYFVIGRFFPNPAENARAWRLGAWALSGLAWAAHVAYEHFRLRQPARATATHVAVGVALGAFGLAAAAMLHAMSASPEIRPVWLVALVAWPAFTGLPAWLGAFVAATILRRLSPGAPNR